MVEYYLSSDTTFGNSDDRKIGDTGFGGVSIAAGATWPVTLSSLGLTNMTRFWTQGLVPNGNYYVFAKVTCTTATETDPSDNYGRTSSTFSYTGEPPRDCSATRSLPSCYIPSTPVTVSISCAPGSGTLAYGVEESPPAGWVVGQINEGGTWDDVQKKVKWVFLDGNPRVLSYAATPPSGEDGSKCFAGVINCGGVNVPIAGTNCVTRCVAVYQPADINPSDWRLILSEVIAYATCYRSSCNWTYGGPNPPTLAYVINAATLYRAGECYRYDPSAGAPPASWVSTPCVGRAVAAEENSEDGGAGDADDVLVYALGDIQSAPGDLVRRTLPNCYTPQAYATVSLTVTPPGGTRAYGVEETPPSAWTVSNINEGGTWDATQKKVKWVFLDGNSRTLTYQVTPPSGESGVKPFSGIVNFGGPDMPITGDTNLAACSPCLYAISTNRWAVPANGGSTIVSVTTVGGCGWAVLNPCSSWVSVSPTSGSGNGSVTVSVAANNTGSTRTCTLTIAGQSFSITQNSFVQGQGNYNGFFYEADEVRMGRSGFVSLTLSARGTYSGKLDLGGQRYGFSGTISPSARATNQIPRSGLSPLVLTLQLGGAQGDEIEGRIGDGVWVAELWAKRSPFNVRTNPAPYAGNYTLILPGQTDNTGEPMGSGYGTVRVDAGGRVSFAGVLGDGTRVTQSTLLSADGQWPLYVVASARTVQVLGWLTFSNLPQSDLKGQVGWIKLPDIRARYYPGGFATGLEAVGSRYTPPETGWILNFGTGSQIEFAGGNLSGALSIPLTTGPRPNQVTGTNVTLKFKTSNGSFSGKAFDPAQGRWFTYGGAVLQKLNIGFGVLLGTNQTSQVTLWP